MKKEREREQKEKRNKPPIQILFRVPFANSNIGNEPLINLSHHLSFYFNTALTDSLNDKFHEERKKKDENHLKREN